MLNSLIIYVEDREDDVEILKNALKQARHAGEFLHLANVQAARDYFQKAAAENTNIPAIVLVDLHIHEHSGKDLIQFIRSLEPMQKVPIVSLSGSYMFEDLEKAYETGANLFLIKPSDLRGWTELVFRMRDYFPQT